MAKSHQAAVIPQKGSPLSIVKRATPEPGPSEILIQVKAIAVNPVDRWQRDFGLPPVPSYPAVVGSDVSGIIASVGSDVSNAPAVGSRAIAFASSFYQGGSPDHGAFQEYVLAPSEAVSTLPDALSFEEGAVFPMAVLTANSSWTTIGIPLGTKYSPQDKQAVLIWGGASSVGTLVIQSAKSMGFTVYTTASVKNHEYLKKLGAKDVFDYNAEDVVSQILNAVKRDDTVLRTAVCAAEGSLQPILDVLKRTKGDEVALVAYAPPLRPGAPTLEGAEITFVQPPADPAQRREHYRKCFQGWLRDGLRSGDVVPSPRIQVVDGGLSGLNKALDILKGGVSATKIVVKL